MLEVGQPVRIRILDETLEYVMRLLSPLGIYAFVVGKLSRITGILWGQVRKRGYSGLVSQFVESLVKIIFASQQSAFNYE